MEVNGNSKHKKENKEKTVDKEKKNRRKRHFRKKIYIIYENLHYLCLIYVIILINNFQGIFYNIK